MTPPRNPSRIGRLAALPLALAFGLLPATAAFAQSPRPWLHVQVEGDGEESKVDINLPLSAVEAVADSLGSKILEEAYRAIDEDHAGREHGEFSIDDFSFSDMRAVWMEMRDAPGEWMTFSDEDGTIRARYQDGVLRVDGEDADGGDETLMVRVPGSVVDALFASGTDAPDIAGAINALRDHEGDIVSIEGNDGRVRIWIGPQQ